MIKEAQKIVEANLKAALDKNDAKAVREACIVLKAMDMIEVKKEEEVENPETQEEVKEETKVEIPVENKPVE